MLRCSLKFNPQSVIRYQQFALWVKCLFVCLCRFPGHCEMNFEIIYSMFARSHITLHVRAKKLKFMVGINGRVDRQKLANFKVIFDLFIFCYYFIQ